MEQQQQIQLSCLRDGVRETYVLAWPPEADPQLYGLCLVVMWRPGGFLLALPNGFLGVDVLQGASVGESDGVIGPYTVLSVAGVVVEGEEEHLLGAEPDVVVVDVAESVAAAIVPLSNAQVDEDLILGFSGDLGHLLIYQTQRVFWLSPGSG